MNFSNSKTPLKAPLLSTPSKQLLLTTSSFSAEDCPYCEMKKKFNIGTANHQKCLQHSLKISLDDSSEDSAIKAQEFMNGEEMVEALCQVEASLDYYWENLRQISGGNISHVHQQLDPVMLALKKVQQKMGKFFFDNSLEVSETKPILSQTTLPKKYYNTGSQKFHRNDFSAFFDPQEASTTEAIKDWILHFNKIIQLRQLPDSGELLPYEEDLEMRIFKQSMERKFLAFAGEIGKYEKKVRDLLGKLIFYMQKSSQKVSQRQIEEDILFIQGQNLHIESREAELQKLLVAQAKAMEYLLQA